MNEITLKNYRCFHGEQTARLAPLTLLVGENSTGKTSFLAMIRALWDLAYRSRIPDFKEEPYDLGSFDEIANYRGGRSGRANAFEAGFSTNSWTRRRTRRTATASELYQFEVAFGKRGATPVPVQRRRARGDTWIEDHFEPDQPQVIRFGTSRGSWEKQSLDEAVTRFGEDGILLPRFLYLTRFFYEAGQADDTNFKPISGSPSFSQEDWKQLRDFDRAPHASVARRPFASAPVRSKPRRTYDPSSPTPDPEGDYVPMYLANMFFQRKARWLDLKNKLEDFGKSAGIFDEISIRQLGKRGSEPFQVQVRKLGSRRKGPQRNLIDVGYGVSQVLPVITELLRREAPPMFLLQQPEVHLHPSAQAALGSLFCEIADARRQLVVETHSDHLIDRVRMDIRDGVSPLKPDDVSVLFFERRDLDVQIHSLRIDEKGNIRGNPDSYRKFFMQETQRYLGL